MPDYSFIPASLVIGDAWRFSYYTGLGHYPATDWIFRLVFSAADPEKLDLANAGRRVDDPPITFDGEVEREVGKFYAPSSLSKGRTPGVYHWCFYAINRATSDRTPVASGMVTLQPDPEARHAGVWTQAERTLAAINATIEGRVSKDADAYSIEGRSITRTPLPDLLRLQAIYERKVAAERCPDASPIRYRRVQL